MVGITDPSRYRKRSNNRQELRNSQELYNKELRLQREEDQIRGTKDGDKAPSNEGTKVGVMDRAALNLIYTRV